MPSNPHKIYAGLGWAGYGDWLGTGNMPSRKKEFRSFQACRVFARSLELPGLAAWWAWNKIPGNRPDDIPCDPPKQYKDTGWTNWGDFLGTGNKRGGQPANKNGKGNKKK